MRSASFVCAESVCIVRASGGRVNNTHACMHTIEMFSHACMHVRTPAHTHTHSRPSTHELSMETRHKRGNVRERQHLLAARCLFYAGSTG